MGDINESLTNLVNSSGFPLQIRLEYDARRTVNEHWWEVLDHEFAWSHIESGEDGFIDLVLCKKLGPLGDTFDARMIIECKRVKETTYWAFLRPDAKSASSHYARLHWSDYGNRPSETFVPPFGWFDFRFELPMSEESEYCVVQGHSEKDKPMLERLSGLVLKSTIGIATAEADINRQSNQPKPTVYIPVIVTTAKLYTCQFIPKDISQGNGELQLEKAEFTKVPFISFRKSLETQPSSYPLPTNLREVNQQKERTVFIVQSVEFTQFLAGFQINDRREFPWTTARNAKWSAVR